MMYSFNTQHLLYSTSSKKELPEKCCNPGTLINTKLLYSKQPQKTRKKNTPNDSFLPMLPETKKARQEKKEMVQILDFRVIPKLTLSSALSLTLQPLFHPQFECILKTSKIGLLFHKTGYQFRKICRSHYDEA